MKSKQKDEYKAKIKAVNKKNKKMSKEEVDKIKLEKKLRTSEFNYIEDLIKIDSHLQQLKQSYNNNKMCYIDPGKRSPVTILRNDGETYETKEKTENLKLNINGKMKKIHAVLTFKKSDGGMCCINRDKNAVKNMKSITKSLLTHKKRPQEYSRSQNLNTGKTGVNSGSENFTSKYQCKKKIKIIKNK